MAKKEPLYPHVPKRKVERLPQTWQRPRGLLDELLVAAEDEHSAYLLYSRLADELEKRGLHRAAGQLNEMAGDESGHEKTLQTIINEIKVMAGLIGATSGG